MRGKYLLLIYLLAFLASISYSYGVSRIKKLTSTENSAKQAEEQEEETKEGFAESPPPGIPRTLQKSGFGIGLGQTFTQGDFRENGGDEITWDLLYNYSASYSFDMLISFHHSKHELEERYVRLSGLTIGIKGKLYHFDGLAPFVVGGLGFYVPIVKRATGGPSEKEVIFGTHFGAGGDLRLNDKFTMGLLAQYHNPFDIQQKTGPPVEGSYFKLLVTTFYTF